jgi:fatty acid desaturase
MTDAGPRSAIVRCGPFFSLLYLNNNLHHTHHVRPGVPWFELPDADAELGAGDVVAAGAGLYAGYGEIARRFLLRPIDAPVRPSGSLGTWSSSTTPAPSATA